MKLIKKIKYNLNIKIVTGMHIGGTNSNLGIGGPDKVVIRNPMNNKPIIPGSSLKGKMRSLLELRYGITDNGGVSKDTSHKVVQLFGSSAANNKQESNRPSRILVRDFEMANSLDDFDTDLPYTESKTEVSIDRITAKANPRTFERVPAGATFGGQIIINIFSDTNEQELIAVFKQGIELLENDYIGGHGSRGYGQIKIEGIDEPTILNFE